VEHPTFYRTTQIDGLSIFSREAGPKDAVAHNEGLGTNWQPRRAFWADREALESTLRTNLLSRPSTRTRHVGNDPSAGTL
jgi:hypothetical protein